MMMKIKSLLLRPRNPRKSVDLELSDEESGNDLDRALAFLKKRKGKESTSRGGKRVELSDEDDVVRSEESSHAVVPKQRKKLMRRLTNEASLEEREKDGDVGSSKTKKQLVRCASGKPSAPPPPLETDAQENISAPVKAISGGLLRISQADARTRVKKGKVKTESQQARRKEFLESGSEEEVAEIVEPPSTTQGSNGKVKKGRKLRGRVVHPETEEESTPVESEDESEVEATAKVTLLKKQVSVVIPFPSSIGRKPKPKNTYASKCKKKAGPEEVTDSEGEDELPVRKEESVRIEVGDTASTSRANPKPKSKSSTAGKAAPSSSPNLT
jgi:hypothetical protein